MMNIKKLNINLLIFFVITSFYIFNDFESKTIVNKSNALDYQVQLTYYYPGDATGSTSHLGSGVKLSELKLDSNGWYYYPKDGTDYLVIAAATTYCRDSANHCGIDVAKHGIAKNIGYYKYYDVIELNIGGLIKKAMVLDACGACMWGKQDRLGEKFDVFTKNGKAVKPGIYLTNKIGDSLTPGPDNNSNSGNYISNFTTTYDGNLRKGFIYEKQKNNALVNVNKMSDEQLHDEVFGIIDEIFGSASTSNESSGGDFEVPITADETEAASWKQYSKSWGSIKLGNSKYTIKSAGCLATSVAIQIARSNTGVTVENFNPGTWVNYLNQHSGFTSGGLFKWNNSIWSGLAPNFVVTQSNYALPNGKQAKIDTVRTLLSQGYYPIMCVKKNCGHWVAVTGVTNDDILIADPGSNSTKTFAKYSVSNVTRVALFKKYD